MKIALISAKRDPFISPQDMDGGCVVLRNYIKSLHLLGHDIHVFTRLDQVHPKNKPRINLKAELQNKAGIGRVKVNSRLTIYRLPYDLINPSETVWEDQLMESVSFLKQVQLYFDVMSFDVYHYFHLLSLAGWFNILNKIPYAEKTTISPLLLSIGREFEYVPFDRIAMEKKVFENISTISCQSMGEIKKIEKHYGINDKRLIRIPLGVDRTIFYPKDEFNNVQKDESTIIVCPNTIKPQKQQVEVVSIINGLLKQGDRVKTVIVGKIINEEYYRTVIDIIEKFGIKYKKIDQIHSREDIINSDADIIFLTEKKEKELADILRISDIALFPSLNEGFNLLNLDCMSCGTLPICYNLNEYKEYLLPNENAIVIEKKEGWLGFVDKIHTLIINKERIVKMSKIAANSSRDYSWDNLLIKQQFIYNMLYDNEPVDYHKYNIKNWINLSEEN